MTRRTRIEQMLQETPDDVFLIYSLAMEFVKEGDLESAQQQFALARRLDPDYVPAYFQEGQALAGAGRVEQSRAILAEGIAAAQRTGDSHALGEMREFLESLG